MPTYGNSSKTHPAYTPKKPQEKWSNILLGRSSDGMCVEWDVKTYPHVLTKRSLGQQEDMIQDIIVAHCAVFNEDWEVMALNSSDSALKQLENYPNIVSEVASTLKETLALLERILDVMKERYAEMERMGVPIYKEVLLDLETGASLRSIMILVDEANILMTDKDSDSEVERFLRSQINLALGKIARTGRAAGLHLIVSEQDMPEANGGRTVINSINFTVDMKNFSSKGVGLAGEEFGYIKEFTPAVLPFRNN